MNFGRFKAEFILIAFLASVVGLMASYVIGEKNQSNIANATTLPIQENFGDKNYVGLSVCADCHILASDQWAHTIHAKGFQYASGADLADLDCEACHGPGSSHVEDPSDISSIIRFSRTSQDSMIVQNGQCLNCHGGGERIHWEASVHESADLGCADCHNPMGNISTSGMLAKANVNETCMNCHKDQRIDFRRRSHMPLFEGKVTCVDCHNPHGTLNQTLLRTATVNETCYGCHAEKRGPFLFEHAPVREDCSNCHLPHGSNHEKLLITARPILCQQCHSMSGHMNDLFTRGLLATGSRPDARLMGRSCQNCHTQIHGSNHPSGSKFHR